MPWKVSRPISAIRFQKGIFSSSERNFGSGSAREQAALALKHAGIGGIIAESFARTFYRNAINVGLPAVELKGIRDKIDEKDEVEVDLDNGVIQNMTQGENYQFPPLPPFLMEILKVGGAIPYYKGRIGRE